MTGVDRSVSLPAPANAPSNVYGGYLAVAFDNLWG